MKHIEYDGITFTKDERSGYYLSSKKINGKRIRLHVYTWVKYNGEIPENYDIHHIDGDKDNNNISNLQLLYNKLHNSLHGYKKYSNDDARLLQAQFLKSINQLAKEWHKSEAGKQWHREHYYKMANKIHTIKRVKCDRCGKEFDTKGHHDKNFCSISCRNYYHAHSGIDDIEKICAFCGKPFMANKYRNTLTCSRKCGASMSWKARHSI